MIPDFHWESNMNSYSKHAKRYLVAALRIIDRVVERTRSLFISFVPWLTYVESCVGRIFCLFVVDVVVVQLLLFFFGYPVVTLKKKMLKRVWQCPSRVILRSSDMNKQQKTVKEKRKGLNEDLRRLTAFQCFFSRQTGYKCKPQKWQTSAVLVIPD